MMDVSAFQSCFAGSPVAFALIEPIRDPNGRTTDFRFRCLNAACASLLGVPEEPLPENNFFFYFSKPDPACLNSLEQVASQGATCDVTIPCGGRALRLQGYQPEAGYCACLVSELSGQEHLEDQLDLGLAALDAAIRISGLVYWEYVPGQDAVFAGPGIWRQFPDLPAKAEVCLHPDEIEQKVAPESLDACRRLLSAMRRKEEHFQGDLKAVFTDRPVWVNVRGATVAGRHGETARVVGVIEKINDYKELELLFRTTLDQIGATVCTYEYAHKRITHWDKSRNIYGDPGMVVEGVPELAAHDGRVHPDDLATYYGMYKALAAGAPQTDETIRWRNSADEGWRWLKILYTNVFDSAGHPVRALCATLDVTDRKMKEADYQKWVLTAGGDTACHCNLTTDSCLLAGSDNAAPGHGKAVDAAFAGLARSIPNLDDLAQFKGTFSRASLLADFQEGRNTVSLVHRHLAQEGLIRWMKTTATLNRNPYTGDVETIICQKFTDSELNGPLAIDYEFIVEINLVKNTYRCCKTSEPSRSKYLTGNNYVTEMLEYINAYVIPEDRQICTRKLLLNSIRRELAIHPSFEFSYRILGEDGSVSRKQARITALDSQRQYALFTRRDLPADEPAASPTPDERTAGSALLAGVSHELLTPLHIIIGTGQAALQHEELAPDLRAGLQQIEDSAHTLLLRVRDLLDLRALRLNALRLEPAPFNLGDLMDDLDTYGRNLAQAKKLSWSCLPVRNARYAGDAGKLKKALTEVIDNAAKFTPAGKAVEFSCEQAEQRGRRVHLVFTVCDEGRGVNADFLPHACEAFSRQNSGSATPQPGAGLGLALCSGLAALMDGSVHLGKRPGGGTRCAVDVWVSLPDGTAAEAAPGA